MLHTLYQQSLKRQIPFYDEWLLTRLAVRDRRVVGAVALHIPSGELRGFLAGAVVVAGGGHGRIYAKSTNSYVNVGSATAAVFRAGVPLEDMEFVQFHPTTLYGTNILITEGVRGEGGTLLNAEGERFMARYAPDAMELAPRDIVARAIQTEVDEGRGFEEGYVQLDVRHLGEDIIKERLPGIRQIAMDFAGVDPIETPIPVQPGQHYSMGGLACDENGETDVAGLFVVGECSCISVHGANRLGGNSLLETIVFGRRAGERAALVAADGSDLDAESTLKGDLDDQEAAIEGLKNRISGERQIRIRRKMQDVMTAYVGVFRNEDGLAEAVERLAELKERYRSVTLDNDNPAFNYDLVDTLELGGMLELAQVTALTALKRAECRGSHWRTDHLGRDDERWLRHSLARYNPAGQLEVDYKDVIITNYPPQEREY
jgi:succinate dehydrogenase / fumarate reductase flavoprotein subunit